MRRLVFALLALFLLRADMYPDASNAKLPEAVANLGLPGVLASNYGVKCDGAANDTAALQAAIAAAQARAYPATGNGGGTLWLPAGFCLVSAPLLITNGITIVGAGQGVAAGVNNSAGTVIRTSSATADIFTVTTDSAVAFDNFAIDSGVAKTAGAAISLAGATVGTTNIGSRITRVYFGANNWNGVYAAGAYGWTVTSSRFHSNRHNNITVAAASAFPDGTAAGIKITENAFFNLNTGPICNADIEVNGGGAVHIANNKFKGCDYNILLNLVYGHTGTLLISNNGFEDTQHAHIGMMQTTAGKEYGNVAIIGNEFSVLSSSFPNDKGSIWIGPGTPTTAANWLRNVTISANVFNNSVSIPAGVINVQDGLGVVIAGNAAWSANNPTTPFLSVASPAQAVTLGADNTYYGTANAGKWGAINWPSMTAPKATRLFGSTTIPQNTTNFISPGTVAPNAGVGPAAIEAAVGVLRSLRVGVVTPPAAGQTYTFAVQTENAYGGGGGSVTPLTCTISNPATTCNDLTHSAPITAGGAWVLKVVTSAVSGSTGVINASVGLDQ